MRLRSPAEFYIKYLLAHPNGYSTEAVRERLLDEYLDFISDEYLERVRSKLRVPKQFRPDDRRHKPSMQFILDERINRAFQPDVPMKMALAILEMPGAKEFVETALLLELPLSAISQGVTYRRGVYCTASGLEVYRHYFWNLNLIEFVQRRMIIELRFANMASVSPELRERASLVKAAYFRDARRVAADLPHSPAAAILAQLRLGMKPNRMERSVIMREAAGMGAIRALEAVHQDGPGDSQKYLNYASGQRIFEEVLQMVEKPEESMREQLQSIALRTETRDVPSIHQLDPAGQHTVDISPLRDPQHDEPEYESEHKDPDPGTAEEGDGGDDEGEG
jgi:hypothetical protein